MRHNTIHKLSAIAGMAALLLAGCQKDNALLRIRFDNFVGDDKAYMDYITPYFETGDAVCVNQKIEDAPTVNMTDATSGTMEVESDPTGYRAVYPDEYVTAVNGNEFLLNIPRVQEYRVNDDGKQQVKVPMGGVNNGSDLEFHNLGAMLAIVLENDVYENGVRIDSVQVCASHATLWGPAVVSDITANDRHFDCTKTSGIYGIVSLAGPDNGNGYTSLGITLDHNEACTLYVSVPAIDPEFDNRFSIITCSSNSEFNIRYTRTQKNPYGGNIQLNRLAFVKFPISEVDDSIKISSNIDGLYSIGVITKDSVINHKHKTFVTDTIKVDFTNKGNLQVLLDASGNVVKWQFANHQWDLIQHHKTADTVDANLTLTSGWVDLFGHSVSQNFDATTNTAVFPTSNNYGISLSPTKSDYQGYFLDWGRILGVIAAEGTGWETLSAAEWGFLLGYNKNSARIGASNKFFSDAKVCGVPGIVFLPDVWSWTGSLYPLNPANHNKKAYYDADEWSLMETAGAIFLPTGAQRKLTKNDKTGVVTPSYYYYAAGGLYATTDPGNNTTGDDNPAHPIHNHNHGRVGPEYGLSVRLAHNRINIPLAEPIQITK